MVKVRLICTICSKTMQKKWYYSTKSEFTLLVILSSSYTTNTYYSYTTKIKVFTVKKNQKVTQIFFRSSPYSDSFGPIWVVRSYSNMEVIEKKFKALFGFFNGENLDFVSIWATQNHLLQQGKFWLCAIISLFCLILLHIVQISLTFTKDSNFYTKWGYS